MIRANPPSSSGSLRVPFLFVPDGAGDPPEVAQFKADYPGWVRFRACFRPRSGSQPHAAALLPIADVEEQTLQPQARPGQGPRQHGPAPAAPGLAMRGPPPRLPAHHAPPAAYTEPQALMAQASIALSPAGRAALIRSTLAMLDAVARRAAIAATVAETANPAAVAGAILLTPKPAGAGEEQALRRVLAGRRAAGRQHFDMPPPSPPLPGLVPPALPARKPGEGGFTPAPPTKPNPGFSPAPPARPVLPGRPPVANKPVVLDSRKTEPSYSGETELSRILAPGGQPVGWVEKRTKLNIRTVTATQFAALKEQLLKNAAGPESDKDYDGKVYQLPDGERFGLRTSKNHGETIDVMSRATTQLDRNLKIHWNPGNDRRTKAP